MNKVRNIIGIAALLLATCTLHAQTIPGNVGPTAATMPAALQNVGFEPPLHGQMPLDLAFRDETGRNVQLREYFGQKPVVLAFVYYGCPMLCDQVEQGVVGVLRMLSFNPGRDYEVVFVSFDSRETPQMAAEKKKKALARFRRPETDSGWHFLTGSEESIDAATRAANFRFSFDAKSSLFAHASGVMVLTSDGRISRYFYGVEYPGRDMRLGLVDASAGRIGTPIDHVLLYCYHYDPSSARYSASILKIIRLGGVLTILCIIGGVCFFFAVAITLAIVFFFFKYHRKEANAVGVPIHGDSRLEAAWMIVPLILAMALFGWGAVVYVDYRHTPQDTLDVYVIAKQWMWKAQQPNGLKEINELHVPVGRNVRLTLASEDVIHDFYVPAFRVKMDVVPGHYNTMWFRPTKQGRYHFFCSQYCGTNHALMGGWVTVLEPAEYEAWLSGSSGETSPVAAGAKLFQGLACNTCHTGLPGARGPSLTGVYGSTVRLEGGQSVAADDAYIRESILQPKAKIVAGYQPIMPTFQGLVTEEQVLNLIAYIKSLQAPQGAAGLRAGGVAAPAPAAREKKRTR